MSFCTGPRREPDRAVPVRARATVREKRTEPRWSGQGPAGSRPRLCPAMFSRLTVEPEPLGRLPPPLTTPHSRRAPNRAVPVRARAHAREKRTDSHRPTAALSGYVAES